MHTRISIVHVIPAIANEASGPSYSVVRLCETLIDRSEHVALAALRWSTISSSRPFVTLFELSRGLRRLGVSPEMNRWLRALALSHGMDIIHSHGLWMMPNIYAGRAARAGACTLIVSPRGTLSSTALARAAWRKRAFWTLYQRDMLRRATGFHATAESELAEGIESARREALHAFGESLLSQSRYLILVYRRNINSGMLPVFNLIENDAE